MPNLWNSAAIEHSVFCFYELITPLSILFTKLYECEENVEDCVCSFWMSKLNYKNFHALIFVQVKWFSMHDMHAKLCVHKTFTVGANYIVQLTMC